MPAVRRSWPFLAALSALTLVVALLSSLHSVRAADTIRIVVENGRNGEPVPGAIVHIAGRPDYVTDSHGVVVVPSGELYARVRAAGFERKLVELRGAEVIVGLKEVIPYRTLRVYVKYRNTDGRLEPLAGADVIASGAVIVRTDDEGFAKTEHTKAIGDELRIEVTAANFETQVKKIIVGAPGISVTSTADSASFVLEKSKPAMQLTVEVFDSFSDNPISGAQITLYKPNRFPGTPVAHATADSKGEGVFGADQVSEARLQGAARVGAAHTGYENAVQDVPADILEKSEARYLVFLKPKSAFDLSGEWRMTWTWTVTSVDFVGTVSQSGDNEFTFQGLVESGGNAIWTARKGSGHASCTLTGKPGTKGKMSCTVTFPDKTWTGSAEGQIDRTSYGAKSKFSFDGRYGKGHSSDTPPGSPQLGDIDTLDLSPKN